MRGFPGLFLCAAVAACASQPTPKPDDMSAVAHRSEADLEHEAAKRSLGEHGDRTKLLESRLPGDSNEIISSDEYGPPGPVLGPRGATPDLYVAQAHAEHARQHEAAALELERFENAECADIPREERAACPLLLGAGAVADVKGGVEIRFREGAPVDAIYRRVRCHFAYAQARGFDESATCALYLKAIRIERTDVRIIRITAPDPGTAERLRRASREQVPETR